MYSEGFIVIKAEEFSNYSIKMTVTINKNDFETKLASIRHGDLSVLKEFNLLFTMQETGSMFQIECDFSDNIEIVHHNYLHDARIIKATAFYVTKAYHSLKANIDEYINLTDAWVHQDSMVRILINGELYQLKKITK